METIRAKTTNDRSEVKIIIDGEVDCVYYSADYDNPQDYNVAVGTTIVNAIESGAKAQGSMATKISDNIEQAKEAYGI